MLMKLHTPMKTGKKAVSLSPDNEVRANDARYRSFGTPEKQLKRSEFLLYS